MTNGDVSKGIFGKLTSYSDPAFCRFMRRAFLASAGYDKLDLDRPIVGIADTSSDHRSRSARD
jgi:dihydroxy-acid dehydratase